MWEEHLDEIDVLIRRCDRMILDMEEEIIKIALDPELTETDRMHYISKYRDLCYRGMRNRIYLENMK